MIEIGTTLAGLVLLLLGGELLVRGATAVAHRARLSPAVIGLTVVAAGTSMPELVVSVGAALDGVPDVAIGNVVGSNIYNILLILGLSAVVRPLTTSWSSVRIEWPVLAAATWALHLLARDGEVDRLEGGTFLVGLVVFVVWMIRASRSQLDAAETQDLAQVAGTPTPLLPAIAGLVGGIALLALGSELFVSGASKLALAAGVSTRVIGLTLVAVGTSLPELVTSVVAAFRGNAGVAIGNVLGSNLFNILGILGATALIKPVPVAPETLSVDSWTMLVATAVLLPLMWTGFRIDRWEGAVLFAGAVVWTWFLL